MEGKMRFMRFNSTGRVFGLLMGLIFLPTVLAMAEDGRDFAGSFSVTDAVGGSEEISVTLKLEIFNYSGGHVTDATVALYGSLELEPLYQSVAPVEIAYVDHVQWEEPVLVVSREEYDAWLQGSIPLVSITYTNFVGMHKTSGVELVPVWNDGGIQP